MSDTQKVINSDLVGKKGYPRYPTAIGLEPPMKDAPTQNSPIDDGPASPTSPGSVSDRQFFQALAMRGEITEDEALEAVGPGIIPAAMMALIEQLPEAERFGAKMLVRGATLYHRDHALAGLIGALYGWDDAALDEFWSFAATL